MYVIDHIHSQINEIAQEYLSDVRDVTLEPHPQADLQTNLAKISKIAPEIVASALLEVPQIRFTAHQGTNILIDLEPQALGDCIEQALQLQLDYSRYAHFRNIHLEGDDPPLHNILAWCGNQVFTKKHEPWPSTIHRLRNRNLLPQNNDLIHKVGIELSKQRHHYHQHIIVATYDPTELRNIVSQLSHWENTPTIIPPRSYEPLKPSSKTHSQAKLALQIGLWPRMILKAYRTLDPSDLPGFVNDLNTKHPEPRLTQASEIIRTQAENLFAASQERCATPHRVETP